tara:strand:- start:696 stop:881 length:186 start_codon:yes stop_codon:yes gene_type:complete
MDTEDQEYNRKTLYPRDNRILKKNLEITKYLETIDKLLTEIVTLKEENKQLYSCIKHRAYE